VKSNIGKYISFSYTDSLIYQSVFFYKSNMNNSYINILKSTRKIFFFKYKFYDGNNQYEEYIKSFSINNDTVMLDYMFDTDVDHEQDALNFTSQWDGRNLLVQWPE
jgi:hypothetical protein